jgi:hypothetical protein
MSWLVPRKPASLSGVGFSRRSAILLGNLERLLQRIAAANPYRKSDSDILMMQPAEDGPELDASNGVHRAPNWCVFRKRQVRSNSIVIIHVG